MMSDYRVVLSKLSEEDGGGWLATSDDLPGCMADGETPEEALKDWEGAEAAWLDANAKMGRPTPKPSSIPSHSGIFTVRMPVFLHTRLAARAETERTSINQFVTAVIAKELGKREGT